ncbi:MAG: TIGR00269 family protein [Candidatus Bathyarchaeia archaeon]
MNPPREVLCSRCSNPATTYIRYAKLKLCREHFLDYILVRVEDAVRRYKMIKPRTRILAAVSGGKDSSTMFLTLSKLTGKLDFDLTALHIDLGIDGYSREARSIAEEVCRIAGVRYAVLELEDLMGLNIAELSRRIRRPPCSVCGAVKRYLLNLAGVETGVEAVALGHHLDDLAVYMVKNFLLQNLEGIRKLGPKTERYEGVLVGRIRPLYEVYERDTALYVSFAGIPYQSLECPFHSVGMEDRIRAFLDGMEEDSPGFKIAFARSIARSLSKYPQPRYEVRRCGLCGMPSQSDVCSFCRMMMKVLGKPLGLELRDRVREIVSKL